MPYVGGKAKKHKKSSSSKKRALNPFMIAKEQARKSGAKEFQYKGKTYSCISRLKFTIS